MAFIQMNLMSASLMRTVPVNVILPADKLAMPGMPERGDKPYQTLYLLHGIFGNHMDWITGSRIQQYAEAHDLAVVMPAGDNASYLDSARPGNNYGAFVGEELVALTRKIFPLSHKREDTFIGGLSMGGYGALRNGLKYHDTFGAIISLSGAFVIDDLPNSKPGGFPLNDRNFLEGVYGDLDTILESDRNPKVLARQLAESGAEQPGIFMACGESDFMIAQNRDMAAFLQGLGLTVHFETGEGGHDWNYWDAHIQTALDWLPTNAAAAGLNSGNVDGKA